MRRIVRTGFNRRVELPWFERAAQLVLTGASRSEIEDDLNGYLQDRLAVGADTPRNARDKTITILVRTWVSPPTALMPLRDDGLRLLQSLPPSEHLAVHWGMAMAVYPFFGLVADVVGRLLRLQGRASAAQVQRRVKEQLGDRETVARCTRYVLRTFADWNVLADTAEKGVYLSGPVQTLKDPGLRGWLIEAALRSSGTDVGALRALTETPAFFPFALAATSVADIGAHARLEWFRQGVSEDMVALREAG